MALRFLTAGESHGPGLMGIIEGLPAQLPFDQRYLEHQMKRRKLGYGRGFRQKIETDQVDIWCGMRFGLSLGGPIGLLIPNKDWKNWQDIMSVWASPDDEGKKRRVVDIPRPGHADYLGGLKYQHQDMRNVLERASARETAMRVALGTLARKFLEELEIHIASRMVQIGKAVDTSSTDVAIAKLNEKVDQSEVRCLDEEASQQMIQEIDQAKKAGDTLGGIFETYIDGLPPGIGSYSQWDRRIEGPIAQSFMSLNAIKGIEIGLGFELGRILGSESHDELSIKDPKKRLVHFKTNRAGGITGGMSTGQTVVIRTAMKPIATLMKPLASANLKTGKDDKAHVERSDVCASPAAAVISESLAALCIADEVLKMFGGDSMEIVQTRIFDWRKRTV